MSSLLPLRSLRLPTSARRSRRKLFRGTALRTERLEERAVLASAALSLGNLTITYAAPGESVTVSNDGVNINLTGATTASYPTGSVNQLTVTDPSSSVGQSLTLAGSPAFNLSSGVSSTGVETVGINNGVSTSTLTISADSINSNAAGVITVSSSAQFTNTDASSTLLGAIGGAGSVTKSGAGTLTLSSGSSSYGGALLVDNGTLSINSWNNFGANGPLGNSAANITLGGAATQGTLQYTGPASNSPATVKGLTIGAGGGKVQLSFVPVNVAGQYVHLNGSSLSGAGTLTVDTSNAGVMTSRFILVGPSTFTGSIIVNANTQLQTNSLVTGDTAAFGVGSTGTGPAITMNAGSILDIYAGSNPANSPSILIGSLNGTGTLQGESAGNYTFKIGSDNTPSNFSGVISGGNGATSVAVKKVGSGTLTLSGPSTYGAGTTISQGALVVGNATGAGSGTVTLNDAATGASNTNFQANGAFTVANPIVVSNNGSGVSTIGTTTFNVGAVPTTFSGTVALNKATTFFNGNADRTAYTNVISGSGAITITGPGVGGSDANRTNWDNNGNNFTGNISITGSNTKLQLNNTNVIPDTIDIDVGTGNYLYFNTASETIDALTGGGQVQKHPSVGGLTNFTIGADNTVGGATFSGAIANGGGTVGITKIGTGTQIFTGANSYTGPTNVNNGTLQIGSGGGTGALAAGTAVTITSPGTLLYNRNDSGAEFVIGHTVSGNGAWNFTSPGGTTVGRYQLTGNNSSFSGTMAIANSRVNVTAANQLGTAAITVNPVGQVLANGAVTFANSLTLNSMGWIEGSGNFGALRLVSTATWSGPITLSGNSAIGNTTGEIGSITGAITETGGARNLSKLGGGSITFTGTGSNTYSGTTILDNGNLFLGKTGGAVAISGPVQMGGGNGNQPNLRMDQPNQFGAGVVMSSAAGQSSHARFDLQGNDQTLAGLVSTHNFIVVQNERLGSGGTSQAATLTLNGGSTYSYSGYFRDEDDGGNVFKLNLVKTGAGTQTLAGGVIYYTGTTLVNQGVLNLSNTTAFNSSVITSTSPGNVNFFVDANNAVAIPSQLSGDGTYSVDGPGGGTVFQNRVILRGLNSNNTGQINVVNGGKLWLDRNNNSIGDSSIVNVGASGQFFIYSDATPANQVAETIGALTGSGSVFGYLSGGAVQPSLTIGGGNVTGTTFSGAISDQNGSQLTIIKTGSGTQTLSGNNTYSGGTTVLANGGTLIANVSTTQNAIGTGAASVGANATLLLNNTNASGTGVTIANTFSGAGLLNLKFAAGGPASNTTMNNVNGMTGTIQLSTSGVTGDKWNVSGANSTATVIVDSGTQLFVNTTASTFGAVRISGTGNTENRGAIRMAANLTAPVTLLGNATIGAEGGVLNGTITTGVAGTSTLTVGTTNSPSPAANMLNGVISNGVGTLALNVLNANTGNIFINGGSLNTYSGGTTLLNSGAGTRLVISSITGTPYGSGPITIGQAATDLAGIYFITANQTLTNAIIMNTARGTDRPGIRSDVTGITLSGQITANLAPATLSTSGVGGFNLTGKITGPQGLTLDTAFGTSLSVSLNNGAGTNDYLGDTRINGGIATLNLGANNQIPDGATAGHLYNYGTLNLNGFSDTVNGLFGTGTITNGAAATTSTLTVGGADSVGAYSGVIQNGAGTTALTKIGLGTLYLAGSNTYTGSTTISAGKVQLGITPIAGSIYQLDATQLATLFQDAGGTTAVTTSGQNVGLWKDTANVNNFSQATAAQQPTYQTGAINGLPAIRFDGSATTGQQDFLSLATSTNAQSVFIVNRPLNTLSGLDGIWGQPADTGIRAQDATNWQYTGGNANDFVTPSSGAMYINGTPGASFGTNAAHLLEAIRNSAMSMVTTSLAHYFTLFSDASRSYNGDIGEILVYNSALTTQQRLLTEAYLTNKWLYGATTSSNILSDSSAITVTGGATLDLFGKSETIGSLAGAGTVTSGAAGAITLTTGGDNANASFGGVIQNGSGSVGLTKIGAGIQTLTGSSTYSGATIVNAGTLQLAGNRQAYQIAPANTTGNQAHTGSLGYDFTVNAGKQVTITQMGFYDSGLNGLATTHNVYISPQGGGTPIVAAVVPAGAAGSLLNGYRYVTLATPVVLSPGNYTVWGDYYGSDIDFNNGSVEAGPVDTGAAGEITFIAGSGKWNGTPNAYPVNADGGAGLLHRYGAASFIFATTNILPTGTALTLNGAAVLDVQGVNQTVGSLSGVAGTSAQLNGAAFTVNGAASTTYSGVVSGNGSLTKSGAGTLTLAGANTYAGNTTINAGTLEASNVSGSATGTGTVAVNNTGTLAGTGILTGAVTVNSGGSITGGTLGTVGTLTVGALNFNGGTLRADFNANTSDTIATAGAVDLNAGTIGAFVINSQTGVTAAGNRFTLINNTHASNAIVDSPFPGFAEGATTTINGVTSRISYAGGAGANDFTISADGPSTFTGAGNLELRRVISGPSDNIQFLQGGVIIDSRPFAGSTTFAVTGSAGNDTLNINYTNVAPASGYFQRDVSFNGGTAGFDTLNVSGGTFGRTVYNYTNATDGNIKNYSDVAGTTLLNTITYTGLSPVVNSSISTNVVFNLPNATNNLVLEDAGGGFSTIRTLSGPATFELTTFTNPSAGGSVVINGGTGADQFAVGTLASPFAANLTLDGQLGTDTLSVNRNLSLTGSFTASAETISLNGANITSSAGGVRLLGNVVSGVSALNPSAYYRLGEASGTFAADSSGNAFNGTYVSSPTLNQPGSPAGFGDTSMQLNGVGGYMVTPSLNSQFGANTNVSLSVWFKSPASGGVVVAELGSTTPNAGWHDSQIEVQPTGEVRLRVWPFGGAGLSLGTASFNAWHHVVLRYNQTTTTLDGFLDGVQSAGTIVGTRQTPQINGGASQHYSLGTAEATNLGNGVNFNGQIDEFAVFNRPLTNAEVSALFAFGLNAPSTPTINTSASNGAVQITGTVTSAVNGLYGLAVNAGAGAVTFGSSIGSTTNALSNLAVTTSGQITIGGSIRTDGGIAGGSGNVTFAGGGNIVLGNPNYANTVLADAPTAYWRLGELSGTTANDSALPADNGTYLNGPALGVAGAIANDSNTAVNFDGVNDGVSGAIPQSNSLSVEVWAKSDVANWNQNGFLASSRAANGFIIHANQGSRSWTGYVVNSSGGFTAIGTHTPADIQSAWHHYAMTYDNVTGLAVMYFDGAPVVQTLLAGIVRTTSTPTVYVGQDDTLGRFGDASEDEFAIYQTVLSPGSILAHYQAGVSNPTSFLIDTEQGDNANAGTVSFGTSSVSARNGASTLQVNTLSTGFTAGDVTNLAANNAGGAQLVSVDVDGRNISTQSVTVGTTVDLFATGAITDANGAANNVSATDLIASAVTGIDLDTTIVNLTTTNSGGGNIDIDETNGANVLNVAATNGNADVSTTTGNLNLTTASAGGATGTVFLTATAGAIIDANAGATNITAARAGLTASTGIGTVGDPLETTLANLEAGTATGGIFIVNNGNLAIGGVTAALQGVRVTGSGDISLVNTGSITITANQEIIRSPNAITVQAIGAIADITTGGANAVAPIGTGAAIDAGGALQVNAGRDLIVGQGGNMGDVMSVGGTALITTGRDLIVSSSLVGTFAGPFTATIGGNVSTTNAALNTAGGTLTVNATGSISLTGNYPAFGVAIDTTSGGIPGDINLTGTSITLTFATVNNLDPGPGVIRLTATAGAITDTTPADGLRVSTSRLIAIATAGINLETLVAQLAAENTASGNITIANSNPNILVLQNFAPVSAPYAVRNSAPGGTINVSNASALTVAGIVLSPGAIVLTATDTAGPFDNLQVNAMQAVVSTASSVTLNGGDSVLISSDAQINAATTISIFVDQGVADAAPGTITVGTGSPSSQNVLVAPGGTSIFGGNDSVATVGDTFNIYPQIQSTIFVDGNNPTTATGDTLNVNFSLLTNPPTLIVGAPGSGGFSFLPGLQKPINFQEIETVNSPAGPYHLEINTNLPGASGDQAADPDDTADTIVVRRDGTGNDLVVERTGAAGADPGDFVGNIFQGLLSSILSLRVIGSADNETLIVSDVNGLVDFAGVLPGSPLDNLLVAGPAVPDMYFQGGGGVDNLNFTLTQSVTNQTIGLGNGAGGGFGQGEVLTVNGPRSLDLYFDEVDFAATTGTPGGALTTIADNTNNTIVAGDSPVVGRTRLTVDGHTPFDVQSGAFATWTLQALDGNDNVTINDATNSLGIATSTAVTAVTIQGGPGVNSLTIEDVDDGTGDVVNVNESTIVGLAPQGVTFGNFNSLDLTTTGGMDTLTANFTTGGSPLQIVNLRGSMGADTILVPPMVTGLAELNIFGDSEIDTIGSAAVRLAPSTTTLIRVFGGTPTGPLPPNGNTVGDILYLDMSGAGPLVVVDTVTGQALSPTRQPVLFSQIETIHLYDDVNGVPNQPVPAVEMGDLFLRAGNSADTFQFLGNITPGNKTTEFRYNSVFYGFFNPTRKIIAYGRGGDDKMTFTNFENTGLSGVNFFGEDGNDYLGGTSGADALFGGAGADTMAGSGGNDIIGIDPANPFDTGLGNDKIDGGDGDDTITGGEGIDSIAGVAGNDLIWGGAGNDTITGGLGNDRMYGEAGADRITGDQGHDAILGGADKDTLNGGFDNDFMVGGDGTDLVDGDEGDDLLIGGMTAYDNNDAAIAVIMGTWGNAALTFAARKTALMTTGVGPGNTIKVDTTTVINDMDIDTMYGDAGTDWFFAAQGTTADKPLNASGDTITYDNT